MFFFFNDTATTEIYTLSLHDALPIWGEGHGGGRCPSASSCRSRTPGVSPPTFSSAIPASSDRKSTRLNSSHANISYAVFCLKKKQNIYHSFDYLLSTLLRRSS